MDESFQQEGYEILEHTNGYAGFFRLDKYRLRHRLFRGGMSPVISRELFERGHAVAVLLYDPDRDEIVMLEQFRIGALHAPRGPWLFEVVAGVIEEGETAEAVAIRESEEEAGVVPTALEFITHYLVSPGGTSESISLYCGRVDARDVGGIFGLASEAEDIRVSTVSFAESYAMVRDGRINSAAPIIAIQWLVLNREDLRRRWM
jgi:ADP-ribose pyrophosphatase